MEYLTKDQLRIVADRLYDGVFGTVLLMRQVRQFKRGDEILLWLVKNELKGERMVDFFKDVSGDELNHGVLRGCEMALKYIDGRRLLPTEGLKLNDLM